ncbi:MAG: TIGR04338 family metallohydrolase [Gordonia sp. (in: high G+C Gram-positive bacteria)]|uniref:TIGR04338 family metallohydrolase n=1 Tax=Gordonia sp. (in: high G+C Gram-positive bacteria) TaxID=84139 RepID=UPI0039E50D06
MTRDVEREATTARARDAERTRFYEAERLILALTARPGGRSHTVELAGTRLTVPAEIRFASVESIQAYVDRVLALPAVSERFARASIPVSVRARRGHAAAHYTRPTCEIAVPDDATRWAMRELVVLHELAHHLDEGTGPVHGREFRETLIELAGIVVGPEAALVYRVLLTDAGLL